MTRVLTLRHPDGLALTLSTLGAAWMSCVVPLPDGTRRGVILERGATPEPAARNAYLGATIGRYANRIRQARIALGESRWSLAPNPGSPHQLHGGPEGFDVREWEVVAADDTAAHLALVSPDGDQGFPGELRVEVIYRLKDAMTIEMDTLATVTAPSPVCLTNHAYFNLDGVIGDARDHRLRIAADRYLPVDGELIPLGPLAPVQDTGFDFRAAKPLRTHWLHDDQQRHAGGYDHAFLLDPACAAMERAAAELESTDGRLRLALWTSLPALQLYGGQGLAGLPSPSGAPHPACAGLALEPQFLPDSPNHPEWPQPSPWLMPGETYRHSIRFGFTAH